MASSDVPIFNLSNPKLWVPVYLPLLRGLGKHGQARRKVVYGSRDSAKSHFVAMAIIRRMLREKFKGLMCRKVYDQIKESQYQTIKEIIEGYGWADYFEFRVSPLQIICKTTGARLIALGLDKPGKAKSVKDVSLVWYEEFDEIELADFTQTTLSIRGKDIEEWMTFNSPAIDHWCLKRFFPGTIDKDGNYEPDLSFETPDGMFTWVPSSDPDAVILHTNFNHNPHCNAKRRAQYELLRKQQPEEYRTSGLGLIGRRNLGSLWMRPFSRTLHMREVQHVAELPTHLTWDQNKLPYSTCLAIQVVPMGETVEIRVGKEFCQRPPDNSTEAVCDEVLYTFGEHSPEFYIYGDPTGGNNNQQKERNELKSHYDAIKRHLGPFLHARSMRVGTRHPSIKGRQRFMTTLLCNGTFLRLMIDPSCRNLIGDFEHLVEDENGGYVKKVIKDKETGQQWQERGHCMDALIYFLHQCFLDIYRKVAKV
jgi:hypothetical protein